MSNTVVVVDAIWSRKLVLVRDEGVMWGSNILGEIVGEQKRLVMGGSKNLLMGRWGPRNLQGG